MKPKVTLVSSTPDPLATVWLLWEASKVDGPVPLSIKEVRDTVPHSKLEELFWQVIRQQIPVGEDIEFTFMLEGVSVSFREQMVRHRIGARAGDNYGVDTIPDIATSTWWSQSMRIQDMSTFADRGMYRVPETLKGKTCKRPDGDSFLAVNRFVSTMHLIQDAYKDLVAAGVPMEDARDLIPLGAQHRISWKLTLQALLHIMGKRGCYILQMGLWGPIITGIVNELAEKVHPMFRKIVHPPCVGNDGKFSSCLYRLENSRRVDGSDAHSPCPLYLCSDEEGSKHVPGATPDDRLVALRKTRNIIPRQDEMLERAEEYRALWGCDPYLWK